jgi:DNA (cytosine-5)-methyltransferase 1
MVETMGTKVVDLFAGAGGTSTGAASIGCDVLAAVNHWPVAVASHALNHPRAQHHCEDAAVIDPTTLPAHDALVASPSCTGHTRARGVEQPHHDSARATAWCVVRVLEAQRPRLVVVENVPEMRAWVLYPAWRSALEALGYALSETVVNAADCGVPQERERLFVVGVRGRRSRRAIAPRITPTAHRPARECIDLDGGSWRPWREYTAKSVERIEAAVRRQGRECLVPYYGSRSSHAGRSLDRPIGTLTTRDRYVVVRGDVARVLTVDEQLELSGFPAGYQLTGTRAQRVAQIGNAVPPPLAAAVLRSVLEAA